MGNPPAQARPSAPFSLLSLINMRCIFDNITSCYFILLLILVLHLEQRLTIFDGELRHHRTRPEHIAVRHDVVAEDLGEDPPVLRPPILHLVTCPHPPLHPPILRRIHFVPRTSDFVRVAGVPLVGLNPLARLEEVP